LPRELELLTDLGYEPITPTSGILPLGNFVGRLRLQGVDIDIVSSKLGADGASRLLEDVVRLAANLIYGWSAPTGFPAAGHAAARRPVPYHQLQYLKHVMLDERIGRRFQDAFALVEERPTQRFAVDYPVLPVAKARAVDARTILDVYRHPERLSPITPSDLWYTNPLALRPAASASGDRRLFPAAVAIRRAHLVYDTPENRFAHHLVSLCLMIVGRFVDHPALHRSLRRGCRTMLSALEGMAAARFLEDVAEIHALGAPTQALLKLPGYRELLQIYRDLFVQPSLPQAQEEMTRFLEGKDIARLYEYWVFLKIVEAVTRERHATAPRLITKVSDLGVHIPPGLEVALDDDVRITYNRRFEHDPWRGSYSTPLRPDVTLQVGSTCHLFDAKYRLDRPPFGHDDADVDNDERESFSFKRGDLYKMHTYRDALQFAHTAWVVYPGHEFAFFDVEHGSRSNLGDITDFRGVGAVPLRPAAVTDHLGSLLGRLLHDSNAPPLRGEPLEPDSSLLPDPP
jgi:predicted component of viral defense system (DUF524 family)